jgi:uncharacterized protein (TIGR03067 family)
MTAPEFKTSDVVKLLGGRWVTIYAEVDGEATTHEAFDQTIIEYSGEKFKIEKGGVPSYEGTFFVNASTEPFGIVLMYNIKYQPDFFRRTACRHSPSIREHNETKL